VKPRRLQPSASLDLYRTCFVDSIEDILNLPKVHVPRGSAVHLLEKITDVKPRD